MATAVTHFHQVVHSRTVHAVIAANDAHVFGSRKKKKKKATPSISLFFQVLFEDVPLVHLVVNSGGVYIPSIYTHAR